jgi:hypothetical protein
MGKMEIRIPPAAWRCGYYLFSCSQFYKDTDDFFPFKNLSSIPIDNGPPSKSLVIKIG